ncbi:uncharacterized protein [Primulina huaijiensis]|uniref:uncharacterized protein isoform X1 n=1 Tax=Primulina huaijiensis TaxID=1492673 RepID=UPI003CC75108
MMRKRPRTSLDYAIVDVWDREIGRLSARNFAHRLAASEDLVLRLCLVRTLAKHRGCVNTISFSAAGDILVSGSDDRRIILWDWETGSAKLSFHSGHRNNVFQAKFMPYTGDLSIVTCAADGEVRHAQIHDSGKVETHLLAKHQGRAHKLAIEPGSPHIFYTCGEDGLVQHIDLRTGTATSLFTCKPMQNRSYMSVVHLNAITIDPRNPNLFAVGGSDQLARLFDIRKYKWDASSEFDRPVDYFCPPHLTDDEHVGITGLAFSDQSELLVSYNDEFIYLFARDIGLGPDPTLTSQLSDGSDVGDSSDFPSGSPLSNVNANVTAAPQAYKGHRNCETVKGVNFFGPKCEYVMSGSDCGRIFIWKKKGGELIRVIEADKHVVNCIESHPHATVLASSGIEHDIKIWTPNNIDRATLPTNIQKDMVSNSIHRRIGFLTFGGFYDDDDGLDFYDLNDEDDEDSEDDDSHDDDDDGDDCNHDYSTDSDEVLSEEEVEVVEVEEEAEENDGTDLTLLGESEYSGDSDGSEDGFEEDGDFENAAVDDSIVDLCDIDDYTF